MEIICLGFLLGIVFSIMAFGASVLYTDRKYKKYREEGKNEIQDTDDGK